MKEDNDEGETAMNMIQANQQRSSDETRPGGGFARPLTRSAILAFVVLIFLTGCIFGDDETETALPREGPADATPVNLNEVPEGIEAADVTIATGTFEVEELQLQEGQPTILILTNEDEDAYSFEIVDDLVSATSVVASGTTRVSFTTPNAGRYEARLLSADGEEELDTMRVVVLGPGGVGT